MPTGGETPPSCSLGGAVSCGPAKDQSCCASAAIPGGRFLRSFDGVMATDPFYQATVHPFRLDAYEVTVSRFRSFVANYSKPAVGAGKNPNNPADPGWDPTWPLPADATALSAAVTCPNGTWTAMSGPHELEPIVCVDWYTAFAFCVWDGGRLPTEAEWNFVAAGGGGTNGQRVYPWSSPPSSTSIDATRAVVDVEAIAEVGSTSPLGDSAWGQADMVGNADEWVLDGFVSPYASKACDDCAETTATSVRVLRGGNFATAVLDATVSSRDWASPSYVSLVFGMRCARDLP